MHKTVHFRNWLFVNLALQQFRDYFQPIEDGKTASLLIKMRNYVEDHVVRLKSRISNRKSNSNRKPILKPLIISNCSWKDNSVIRLNTNFGLAIKHMANGLLLSKLFTRSKKSKINSFRLMNKFINSFILMANCTPTTILLLLPTGFWKIC